MATVDSTFPSITNRTLTTITMSSQTTTNGWGHRVIKLTARAILASFVVYAVVSHATAHQRSSSLSSSSTSTGVYWSTAAASQATGTPAHVQDVEHPAAPVPEDVVKADVNDAAAEASRTPNANTDEHKESLAQKVIHKVTEMAAETKDEIDQFLEQLFEEDGIDKDANLTPEQKAEKGIKDAETKRKRAAIVARHEKWEDKLRWAGEHEFQELLEYINDARFSAVNKMRNTPEMFDLLRTMQEEGQKHIENTDKYLLKLKKDDKIDDSVAQQWKTVVEKVQKKLDDKTIEVTTYLKTWHQKAMEKEKAVFEEAAKRIHELAGTAQDDLGMDYAWLDDVSTDDWTRYHGLKDTANKWIEEFEMVFNSTHPKMSENVVSTEILQVETATVRVAADLNELLDGVKKRGEAWVKGEPEPSEVAQSEDAQAETVAPKVAEHDTASSDPVDETPKVHVEL